MSMNISYKIVNTVDLGLISKLSIKTINNTAVAIYNLSIEATDSFGTKIIIPYKLDDSMQTIYSTIRQEFITKYSTMNFKAKCTVEKNRISCEYTDDKNPPNIINTVYDSSNSAIKNREYIIGQFVDLYGMSEPNKLYELLLQTVV